MADPYVNSVSVLVNGRSQYGALGLVNLAYAGGAATATDATTPPVATAVQSKYGDAAVRFASNGFFRIPHGPGNTLTTGDWTIEGWFYFLSVEASAVLVTKSVGTGLYPFQLAFIKDATPGIGLRLFDASTNLVEIRSTVTPSVNTWVHIAATRSGNTFTLWVDGVAVASGTLAGALLTSSADLIIGAYSSNQFGLDGYGDDIRVTPGVARYTAPFTPPAEADAPLPPEVKLLRMLGRLAGELPPLLVPFKSIRTQPALFDLYYGGRGVIPGTVAIKGTPNAPVRRRVRLFRERDGHFVRETWSDPVTGAYVFQSIDETQKYTVVTYDHTHDKRAVVADNLTPDLMP